MTEPEPLLGGRLSSVDRIGATVHRPTGAWTPAVHAVLRHLEASGFEGAPRVLGFDDSGREVLTYIEGDVPWPDRHHAMLGSTDEVATIGGLLRRFHEAVATFAVPADAVWRYPEMAADAARWAGAEPPLVCHNDPGPWNLVRSTRGWALIDWDAAGPRCRLWDVAYAARGVIPVSMAGGREAGWDEPAAVGPRLRALADGYGLDRLERGRLPDIVVARMASSVRHMAARASRGESPWTELWHGSHGRAWVADLHWAAGHRAEWQKWMR